ncbi:MAG: dTMP kinase [Petroclostridium sp.]|nr:dTMP kinase [Petroclostridium sp.]
MSKQGLYIVFEGPDGSGKSMQAQKIVERLNQMGMQTVHFREPGGEIGKQNTIGEKIRTLLQDKDNRINAMCELALFTANRAQLIEEIKAYTDKGINVICERNFLSSVVYQGFGRGIDIDLILQVTQLFVDKLPDLVVLYHVNTREGMERVNSRGEKDRIENEAEEFHLRVFEGYKKLKTICDRLGIQCIEINTSDKNWDVYQNTVLQKILKKKQE